MKSINQTTVAENLLFPLFRSLDEEYKKKYVKDVWEQFENNIRSSAYTSKLSIFFENITRQMPITFQNQYSDGAMQVIHSGMDKEILNWLRDETTFMVLVARQKNEERKAELKEKQNNISSQSNLFENENNNI